MTLFVKERDKAKKTLRYNVTGDKRREMVDIISAIVRMEPVYTGFPTCAYAINSIIVEKDGRMVWDKRTDNTVIKAVRAALKDAGFKAGKRV